MSVILAADDLSPGMYTAVHSCRRPQAILQRGQHIAIEVAIDSPSPAPPGAPLRIIGISLPFVACALVQPGGEEVGPVIVDLRVVRLGRLDPAFVESIVAFDPGSVSEMSDD